MIARFWRWLTRLLTPPPEDFHLYDPRSDGEGMDTRDERNGE